MRLRRIIRRKRVKRRPRRRRKRTFRRPASANQLKLYRGMLPPRAFVRHRATRQIRLEEGFELPYIDPIAGSQGTPVVLIASCNNPMRAFNRVAPAGLPPQSPAFLNGSCVWDNNSYPMLWQFFQRYYSQWTVVGSKITITYRPQGQFSGVPGNLLEFTMLTKQNSFVVGSQNPQLTAPFPTTNKYPSLVKEQPSAYTKTWTGITPNSGNAITMKRSFSTRKGFGKSRGNVIGESNLQGGSGLKPIDQLPGSTPAAAGTPEEEYFYHMYINSAVASAATVDGRTLPPGLFTINIEYSTVWTERSAIPDE